MEKSASSLTAGSKRAMHERGGQSSNGWARAVAPSAPKPLLLAEEG